MLETCDGEMIAPNMFGFSWVIYSNFRVDIHYTMTHSSCWLHIRSQMVHTVASYRQHVDPAAPVACIHLDQCPIIACIGRSKRKHQPPPPFVAQFLSCSCSFQPKCCQMTGFCPKLKVWCPIREILNPLLACIPIGQCPIQILCMQLALQCHIQCVSHTQVAGSMKSRNKWHLHFEF